MRRFLAAAMVGLLACSADAAVLGLRTPDGNLHPEADPLVLAISDTAEIQITLDLYNYTYLGVVNPAYNEMCYGANIFMDSVEMWPNPEAPWLYGTGHEIMEVIDVTRAGDADFIWAIRAFDVDPMGALEFGPLPYGSGIDWEGYYLIASMTGDPPLDAPGGPDPDFARHVLETIVIHSTDVGVDTIWFENWATFQGVSPLPLTPSVFKDSVGQKFAINKALGRDAFGLLGFENGFIRIDGTQDQTFYRDGFWIQQIPEPASLTLLALGGLMVLRHRR
jgi:hypothetical protein